MVQGPKLRPVILIRRRNIFFLRRLDICWRMQLVSVRRCFVVAIMLFPDRYYRRRL